MLLARDDIQALGPAAGAIGRAIRRLRVLRAIKQSDLAERAGVTQATVSRWERGTHRPTQAQAVRVLELLAARLDGSADRALRRLVEASPWKVHLVCDATHRLLAASPARTREWTAGPAEVMGRSLWRFATPQIQAAEARLGALGWHDRLDAAVIAWTDGNGRSDYRILPGTMMWEPVLLSDGSRARLCTSLPLDQLLAMAPDAVVVSRAPTWEPDPKGVRHGRQLESEDELCNHGEETGRGPQARRAGGAARGDGLRPARARRGARERARLFR